MSASSHSGVSRRAGIVIPLFSLRSERDWGIGEIPNLVPFARWASDAGFSVVQMLPVNDVSPGQNSPYMARSAFALDPAYLSLERVDDFRAAGGTALLGESQRGALERCRASATVEWEPVRALKHAALELAFAYFRETEWRQAVRGDKARQFEEYARTESPWLDDYSLFVALHDAHQRVSWESWPEALRHRDEGALEQARKQHADRILFVKYTQWQLDRQWHAARSEAEAAGVALMGNLPFIVSGDSADVWSRAGEFRLDATAGVPPDDFSADGQDWGLPVFRWDVMATNDYEWMRLRARRLANLYRLYRIDHVVGIYRTYFIPRDGSAKAFIPAEEASQRSQGERLIQILALAESAESVAATERVIAEDLGVVPPFVRASLDKLGVPGYRVLRWEKDDLVFRDPATWPIVSVATTGTHDTESLAEWFDALSDVARDEFLKIPGLAALRSNWPSRFDERVRDAILAVLYATPSELALIMFPDAFGGRERINLPGTVSEANWVYRMTMPISALRADPALAESTRRLRALASSTHRLQG